MTIRTRLTLWYALLLTLTIVIFGAMTFGVVRYRMIHNIDQELKTSSTVIQSETKIVTTQTFNRNNVDIQLPPIDPLRASHIMLQAWDNQGNFDGSTLNVAAFNTPLDPAALMVRQETLQSVTFQGLSVRVLTTPLYDSAGNFAGHLQTGDDLNQVYAALRQLLIVMLVTTGFAIAGVLVLSTWFSHRALQPLEQIAHAAAGIVNTDDLDKRLPWVGPKDELGRLVDMFNRMMGRIEKMFDAQHRFVADISHELRTPLTSIKGNLELIRLYGYDEESLGAMEIESKRMERLVDELLMLARADYGSITIELLPTDLDTVVLEASEHARNVLKERKLAFNLKHFEPVRVSGNHDRLKQLVINLLDNAIQFTPDGGKIAIGLEQIENNVKLWVQDNGMGISENELERVFDRFYQSDPARTYNNGGFGLGLSIAQWIVREHNGNIRISSRLGEGTTVVVTLPIYYPYEFQYTELDPPTVRAGTNGRSKITKPLQLNRSKNADPQGS